MYIIESCHIALDIWLEASALWGNWFVVSGENINLKFDKCLAHKVSSD